MNNGLSSRLHPRKSSFVLSWSAGVSATRTMKARDTKRALKPNFPNFPAIRPKAKFSVEQRQICYQKRTKFNVDFENNWLFRKKVLCVTRNCAFVSLIVRKSLEFFCKQTRIGIIPTRKADPNFSFFTLFFKSDLMVNSYTFFTKCQGFFSAEN